MPAIDGRHLRIWADLLFYLLVLPPLVRADAPAWMHAAAAAPLPAHDEKTDAVLLYQERDVTVQSADKVKTHVRMVYRILRPSGREYGTAVADFDSHSKISGLHGWCIPAQGKDYEVKDKDALDVGVPKIEGSELILDVRTKLLRIPAADPGNVVGYEYEKEEDPLLLQEMWGFQREIPVRETHFSLQLPPGWAYKTYWINYPESKPTESGNQLQWAVNDVKAVRPEDQMPPFRAVSGEMIISYFPQGGASDKIFTTWQEMGVWYGGLTAGRRDSSPDIKQEVASLTSSLNSPLAKIRALSQFVQRQVRYVAIELGIGGFQPHPAAEIFAHRYGDCKDKATLLSSMLKEIGIDSYYVVINDRRGSVTPAVPVNALGFNHMILAVRLPDGLSDSSLVATVQQPGLGTLVYFDPTNELTPFGQIPGYLQANYGLLVAPQGGELVLLPAEPATMNGVQRTGSFTLDPQGTLTGEVNETRLGDRGQWQRMRLQSLTRNADRIKPMEDVLAGSLSFFRITKASIINLNQADQPFGYRYTFEAQNYAKNVGGLLLVRPRVLGVKTSALLETPEPRRFAVEFDSPSRDSDSFDIAIPAGYVVDDLPPPVDADFDFASYHSKTQVQGNLLRYSRTLEVKELSVPAARAEELRKFYRIIAGDERNTAVLRAQGK